MEINYKTIGGLLLLVLVTVGGTLLVERTGDYINCRAEWILQENGEYLCPKTNATSLCYEIEERGSGWYRCWTGRLVEIPEEIQEFKTFANGELYTCKFEGLVDSYTKCISPTDKEAYAGELI
ncbi:MAG: hypothetical protein E3J56_01000 [Candidatus Aminicenantes bacterium]|nr:MAG: hypothetical protein E3J56_01000 [Candidatus Aminicenantes bacterium]